MNYKMITILSVLTISTLHAAVDKKACDGLKEDIKKAQAIIDKETDSAKKRQAEESIRKYQKHRESLQCAREAGIDR